MKTRHLIPGAALAAVVLAGQAPAQDLTLRVADSFPSGHYIATALAQKFMDSVAAESGGAVGFEYFPAEQLGKAADLLSLTVDGVVDIGYVGPSYVSDKMPLSAVAQLPASFTSSCEGTLAYWEIAKPGGPLDAAEFAPNGVRLLMVMVLPPYQLVTTGREITGLDGIAGLKIRATGGALEMAVNELGGIPVQMPAPEVREALSRGTVDAGLFPHSSILAYDMTPFLKYGTEKMNFGSFVGTYVISTDKWNALTPEMQELFARAGEAATRSGCQTADELDAADKQKIADAGVSFGPLPAGEEERINERLLAVGEAWAKELDGRGKNGSEILAAFRAARDAAE